MTQRRKFKNLHISDGRNAWTVTGYIDGEGVRLTTIHGDVTDTDGIKRALMREFDIVL